MVIVVKVSWKLNKNIKVNFKTKNIIKYKINAQKAVAFLFFFF